jgi:hypothetical protein
MEDTNKTTKNATEHGSPEDDEIACKGDSCNHSFFKRSEKGCNPITQYCRVCNEKMRTILSAGNKVEFVL